MVSEPLYLILLIVTGPNNPASGKDFPSNRYGAVDHVTLSASGRA